MRFRIYASRDMSERTLTPELSDVVVKDCEKQDHLLVHTFDVKLWGELNEKLTGAAVNILSALPAEVSDYVEWHVAKRIAESFWDGYDQRDGEGNSDD